MVGGWQGGNQAVVVVVVVVVVDDDDDDDDGHFTSTSISSISRLYLCHFLCSSSQDTLP